jgi:hypothetical protein
MRMGMQIVAARERKGPGPNVNKRRSRWQADKKLLDKCALRDGIYRSLPAGRGPVGRPTAGLVLCVVRTEHDDNNVPRAVDELLELRAIPVRAIRSLLHRRTASAEIGDHICTGVCTAAPKGRGSAGSVLFAAMHAHVQSV